MSSYSVYIGSVSSFVKFGGQLLKNVHNVRNVFLEMTLCVYACFVYFYVFVFIKFMWEVLNVYKNIFGLETSKKTSSRTIQGSLRKDPCLWQKLPKEIQPTDNKQWPVENRSQNSRKGLDCRIEWRLFIKLEN